MVEVLEHSVVIVNGREIGAAMIAAEVQNHPAADVRGAAQALREQDDLRSREVAAMMLERLDRRPRD